MKPCIQLPLGVTLAQMTRTFQNLPTLVYNFVHVHTSLWMPNAQRTPFTQNASVKTPDPLFDAKEWFNQLFHYWGSLLVFLVLVLRPLPSSFWLPAALGAEGCLLRRRRFTVPGIKTHFIPANKASSSSSTVEPNFRSLCDGGSPCGPLADVSTKNGKSKV